MLGGWIVRSLNRFVDSRAAYFSLIASIPFIVFVSKQPNSTFLVPEKIDRTTPEFEIATRFAGIADFVLGIRLPGVVSYLRVLSRSKLVFASTATSAG